LAFACGLIILCCRRVQISKNVSLAGLDYSSLRDSINYIKAQ